MMNWLKNLRPFRILIMVIQLKKLTRTQKLKILKKPPKHDKVISTDDIYKFSVTIFDERLKQAKLAANKDLDFVKQRAIKNGKIQKNCKHLIQVFFYLQELLR